MMIFISDLSTRNHLCRAAQAQMALRTHPHGGIECRASAGEVRISALCCDLVARTVELDEADGRCECRPGGN
jgi:hypothetical protein